MEISEPAYERLLEAFDDDVLAFADAWTVVRPREDHPLTCGIYERIYWSSAHCRDFIFITQDLVERARTLDVDQKTDASDHQPLRLVLDLPQLESPRPRTGPDRGAEGMISTPIFNHLSQR